MDVFGFSLLYILHHTKQLDQVHSGVTYPFTSHIYMCIVDYLYLDTFVF